MLDKLLTDNLETPAFIYSKNEIADRLNFLRHFADAHDIKLLFALKCFSIIPALKIIQPHLNGLATSSPFEAKLASDLLDESQSIHFTSPGLSPKDANTISKCCDYVAFNSLEQWNNYKDLFSQKTSVGIRLNPQHSIVKDRRYDPCSPHSKLGIPLSDLILQLEQNLMTLDKVRGLHFHSNCEGYDLKPLFETTKKIVSSLDRHLNHLDWINLGGGYFYEDAANQDYFERTLDLLKPLDLEVFIEPGSAVINDSCYLVASVVDLFERHGKYIAVLDTSVNHLPEVFEYQYSPHVLNSDKNGKFTYLLAGGTCLAGDLFGNYVFSKPLELGSRIIFSSIGAYSIVKAHMFNGFNLPCVYSLDNKCLELITFYNYDGFLLRNGALSDESPREETRDTATY